MKITRASTNTTIHHFND